MAAKFCPLLKERVTYLFCEDCEEQICRGEKKREDIQKRRRVAMMTENEKSNWMIGIGNSDADGVSLHRVYGSKAAVKRHLVSLVKEDKLNDSEGFDYGTTAVKDVEEESGALHAYAVFSDYHIDYTAKPETEPIVL